MTVTVLRAADRAASPWRNGGGVTREVAAARADGAGAGAGADFDWRISLADVAADGPFSAFPGYDRVITVVRGAGMALTVDGTEHRVDRPYRPFAFSGGSATDCRLLGGPVTDFNVMTRAGAVEAQVVLAEDEAYQVAAATAVAVVFEGRAAVLDARGRELCRLGELDAVLLHDEADLTVRPAEWGDGTVVGLVRLREPRAGG